MNDAYAAHAKLGMREYTHDVRLHTRFPLDGYIVWCITLEGWKRPIFRVPYFQHSVMVPPSVIETVAVGTQLQTFP